MCAPTKEGWMYCCNSVGKILIVDVTARQLECAIDTQLTYFREPHSVEQLDILYAELARRAED